MIELDKSLFLFLNGLHSGYWDTVMLMITRKEFWLPFYLVILYFIFKSSGRKTLLVVILFVILLVATDQMCQLIKDFVGRLRPVYEPAIMDQVHNVLRKGGLYGFPSSHAANTFATFIFTSLLFKNRLYSFILIIWAALISYSRIYSGVHYPSDVFAGILLGLISGYLFFRLYLAADKRFFQHHHREPAVISLNNLRAGIVVLVFLVQLVTLFLSAMILHKYNYL